MIDLPIFRAKKLDSDKYIIGQYIETEFSNEEYCDIEEQETIIKHCIIKDFRTVHDDYEYCNFDITEIDIATLAIHFPDMIDSQGNKIFASLQEDGKGGDICEYKDWDSDYEDEFLNKGICLFENIGIFFTNRYEVSMEDLDFKYDVKIIGIQQ